MLIKTGLLTDFFRILMPNPAMWVNIVYGALQMNPFLVVQGFEPIHIFLRTIFFIATTGQSGNLFP